MSDKIRKDFEQWILSEHPAAKHNLLERVISDERYASMEVEWAYRGYVSAIAQQPAPVAVPDGWKFVPLTPEGGMLDNATRCVVTVGDGADYVGRDEAAEIYRAMLAAAPAAPVTVGQGPVAWMTEESWRRLQDGGNDSRGTVPVRGMKTSVARIPLYAAPPAAEQPPKAPMHPGVHYGCCPHTLATNSACRECRDKYGTGFDYRQPPAAEQPDAVKVPRELLKELRDFTLLFDSGRAGVLRGQADSLLGKDGEA